MNPERSSRSTARSTTRKVVRKSPSRKSPGRQSPSRRRSPGRRSPARSPKSKLLSSPSRKLTSPITKSSQTSSSVSRSDDEKGSRTDSQSTMSELNDDISPDLIPLKMRIKDGSGPTRRSIRILTNMMKTERSVSTRLIDRAASLPVERKTIMYEYLTDNKERGFSVQREPDIEKLHYEKEVLPDSSTTMMRSSSSTSVSKEKNEFEFISKPQEFGGWFGALCLIILLPAAIILPQIACLNNKCSIDGYHLPKKWQSYLNLKAFGIYIGYLISIGLISLLPIGKLIDGQQSKIGRLQYRINGLLTAVIAIIVFGWFEYMGYKATDYIIRSVFKWSICGWIIGVLLSIGLYIKAGRSPVSMLNVYASTGNFIYDFWQGREINPRIGNLDFKIVLSRAGIIGMLIINLAIVVKSIQTTEYTSYKDLNATLLIACGLQIFYCLDALFYEAATLTSFKVMYEGTGYMLCVRSLLYPFLTTLASRYIFYQNVHQSGYMLGLLTVFYLTGYIIYRVSNLQKDTFRKNPYAPGSSNLETILTSHGKKLIVSGLWGQFRHPNYLGEIIMHWSIAGIKLNDNILMYYSAVCCTLLLLHRALCDNSRCKTRYGSAWEQYCSRVKSIIMKRVF
ncbi:hypothetical protein PV326_006932 [Microctonus aethiopoides]|nr:hypothetical protein PV326_006932 [Microctonus aethiopoides]